MKIIFAILIGVFSLSAGNAQEISTVTTFELEYWRSFNGVIKQTILRTSEGKIALNTDVISQKSDPEANPKKDHFVKIISEQDLLPLIKLFNDQNLRKAFLEHPQKSMLDGSFLSLRITQNTFTIGFECQIPFEDKTEEHKKALGKVAKYLLDLADLKIPPGELY